MEIMFFSFILPEGTRPNQPFHLQFTIYFKTSAARSLKGPWAGQSGELNVVRQEYSIGDQPDRNMPYVYLTDAFI